MPVFEFSIVAIGLDPQDQDFEARFFDRGADDATISFQRGVIIADFVRDAPNVNEALSSAMEAVREVGARIVRIEPDPLVSLADIAERAHLTRAAVSLYASGQRGRDFPRPVARVTSDSPLWDWADVAGWLVNAKRLEQQLWVQARAIAEMNRGLERPQAPPSPVDWAAAE